MGTGFDEPGRLGRVEIVEGTMRCLVAVGRHVSHCTIFFRGV